MSPTLHTHAAKQRKPEILVHVAASRTLLLPGEVWQKGGSSYRLLHRTCTSAKMDTTDAELKAL